MKRGLVLFGAVALVVAMLAPASAGGHSSIADTTDVLDQMDPETGDRELFAADSATLRRTANGVNARLSIPTPEPGSYRYPTAGEAFAGEGHPEAFSLWLFAFNHPEECSPSGCDGSDVGTTGAQGGAFFVAGHVAGGDTLTLSGRIDANSDPVGGARLTNPRGAEVHLAVAPHGALDSEQMPEQITTPTGPGPDIWWVALFDPTD